jgi:hypothetical protein
MCSQCSQVARSERTYKQYPRDESQSGRTPQICLRVCEPIYPAFLEQMPDLHSHNLDHIVAKRHTYPAERTAVPD